MGLKVKLNQIKIRPVRPEDGNFILATWLKSYRQSDFASAIHNDIYYAQHQALISQILIHPKNSITVLCDPVDDDNILGYVVYNTDYPVVFYMYVKYAFRNLGIGRFLLEGVRTNYKKDGKAPTVVCTHKCKRWSQAAKKFNLAYNPYVIGS